MKSWLRYFSNNEKKIFLVTTVILALIALFLRCYDTPARFSLDGDSVRDAIVAIAGMRAGQLPLTGPFSSSGPFTFGPWYYYQLILFSFLFRSIFAPWISMQIVSLGFIAVMFAIGKEIHNKWFGLLLALFATVSSTQVAVALSLSNINLIALFAGLATWTTIVIIKRKKTSLWWSFLLGTSLGLGMNYHYQMAGLLFLPLFVCLYMLYKRRFSLQQCGSIALGVFLPFIPLLLFNFTNHWETTRGIFVTASYLKNSVYVPNSWTIYITSFWPDLLTATFGIPKVTAVILGLLAACYVGWRMYTRSLSVSHVILLLTFFINFLLLRYYWGERHVVYFSYFHPFLYLFCGEVLAFLLRKKFLRYFSAAFLFLLILFALIHDSDFLKPAVDYREYTQETQAIKKAYPNRPFLLYQCKKAITDVRARAAALFLSDTLSYTTKPVKIAFIHNGGDCQTPLPSYMPRQPDKWHSWESIAYPAVPHVDNIVDFSNASSSSIHQGGWEQIGVEKTYNEVARWWFAEQP